MLRGRHYFSLKAVTLGASYKFQRIGGRLFGTPAATNRRYDLTPNLLNVGQEIRTVVSGAVRGIAVRGCGTRKAIGLVSRMARAHQ
jgi:hypothetical protein